MPTIDTNAMPTALKEAANELKTLREKQAARFEEIKSVTDPDKKSALKEACKAGITEIEEKAKVYEDEAALWQQEQANREALKSMREPDRRIPYSAAGGDGNPAPNPYGTFGDPNAPYKSEIGEPDFRTFGQRLVDSPEYAGAIKSGHYKSSPVTINVPGVHIQNVHDINHQSAALKALGVDPSSIKASTMTTAATWAPYGPRLPGFVPAAIRQPTLRDLIPQETTESPLFYYMEETTGPTGTQAAYVAEGGTKPGMDLVVASRTAEVAKIAATMQISEELLEDIPQFRAYADNRGTLEMDLAEENALLNFTVGANKFDGFLQKSGVQTQARGTDPTPTAILKAMVKVQYSPGFAGMATGLAMNPVDWQNVLTLQETTGAYIWSMPSAPTEMPDMRMWGMTVRPVVALTQGTALTGNFRMFSMLWIRSGLSIRVAWANDDQIKNLVRLIFELRETLVITRGAAFAKITGLPA